MSISVGDKIPAVSVTIPTSTGQDQVSPEDLLGSGRVALFSVPGAYTPTCSAQHLPGFVNNADSIKAKNVDKIVCMSVNDAFVMKAWASEHGASESIVMLADGNAEFAKSIGLTMDGSGFGMGTRSQRFSMLLEDGVVKELNIEAPGQFDVSSAEHLLTQL